MKNPKLYLGLCLLAFTGCGQSSVSGLEISKTDPVQVNHQQKPSPEEIAANKKNCETQLSSSPEVCAKVESKDQSDAVVECVSANRMFPLACSEVKTKAEAKYVTDCLNGNRADPSVCQPKL